MNKLNSMSEIAETKVKYGCDFCKREFQKETTMMKHICEQKRRHLDKDKQGNRLGYQSWLQFYKQHTNSKKNKTYDEFIRSAYYIAFVKFGNYCVSSNVVNVSRFSEWLLKNEIKIDTWCQDAVYTRFLIEYLRHEDGMDALSRSVKTCIDWAETEGILPNDYLRYGNTNRICYLITTGKISPWMLYCSNSGVQFLDKLSSDHVRMITDYINPEQWALKLRRDNTSRHQIEDTLKQAGY